MTTRSTRRGILRAAGGLVGNLGAVGALAACGGGGSGPAPAPAQLPPARLAVYIGGTQDTYDLLTGKQFGAFTALHPGVTVDFNPGNLPLDKLRTLAAGGTTPEIYMSGAAFAPAIADGKFAVALDDRIKQWGKLGDFFSTSLIASSWGGKQWGLPMMVANRTHFWRKNVLAEAGISKIPATWEEAVDAARRTTKVDGGAVTREGGIVPDGWAYFVCSMLTVGKTLFRDGKAEFAGAEGIASMEYLADYNQAVRPGGAPPAAGNDTNKFGTGVQAHTWGNLTGILQVVKTAPRDVDQLVIGEPPAPTSGKYRMPAGDKIKPVSPNFSDWVSIGSGTKYPDHSWELIKFLLEPDQLLPYCESRYFQPPRKAIASQGFMKQPLLQRMVEVFDKFGQAQIRVPDQAIFQKVTQDMASAVYAGKVSAKQAVEDAARQLQNEVDKTGVKWTTL